MVYISFIIFLVNINILGVTFDFYLIGDNLDNYMLKIVTLFM
jgi:hypothetical protein